MSCCESDCMIDSYSSDWFNVVDICFNCGCVWGLTSTLSNQILVYYVAPLIRSSVYVRNFLWFT